MKFKFTNQDAGVNQTGFLIVCDKTTGYFIELYLFGHEFELGWVLT